MYVGIGRRLAAGSGRLFGGGVQGATGADNLCTPRRPAGSSPADGSCSAHGAGRAQAARGGREKKAGRGAGGAGRGQGGARAGISEQHVHDPQPRASAHTRHGPHGPCFITLSLSLSQDSLANLE